MIAGFGCWCALVAALLAAGCDGRRDGEPDTTSQAVAPGAKVQINGAGASFPYPIYSKWVSEYNRRQPNIEINYQPIGSGGGIRQMVNRTVFFGATDSPLSDDQLKHTDVPILQVPTVVGAVVPVHNLPGIDTDLNFTGPLLADIYLGKITKWNDPAIASVNAGIALPATDIVVVHRSDGSGTTFIWVDYLSKVSPEFRTTVGVNTSVDWPVGVGSKGNEGVAVLVTQTPGAIGYVELVYAVQNKMRYGSVKNATGEFVKASPETVTRAAAAAPIADNVRISITNAGGSGAYPIASFTWLLLNQRSADRARTSIMVDFVRWALTDGQRFATELGYAPLPEALTNRQLAVLETIPVS